ncbi:hypothetical protein BV25DRAFT_1912597 [Artomyces pyxidatus]|uniref:Uncharacterized protein n=1 Tax=Artomyces pyxidatus TaxID=48021 RepID=A0ACB8TDN8_9AGAM|nr:hypothetical protein BV25DRAFT_1912597 [Artomyces pyxidatus]
MASPIQPVAKSTPIKHNRSGTELHAANPIKINASTDYIKNAADMEGMFVGPMPIDKFLADFVPNNSPDPKSARPIAFNECHPKNGYEDEFVRAIDATELFPGLLVCNTKHKPDTHYPLDRKPDMSVFRKTSAVDEARDAVNWREIELIVEVKPEGHDPFRDPSPKCKDVKRWKFEASSEAADEVRGQIISYAKARFSSQFRTFSFSVVLMGTYGRLIRWDRSGAIVTERFEWSEQQDTLAEFLWRFTHLSEVERGRDDTVTTPSEEEIARARAALELQVYHYPKGVPDVLHKFLIHDDVTGEDHHFVAPLSTAHSQVITGRATFGYGVAYDLERNVCVYLKDSWRIALADMHKEGDIYRLLHEHGVPNIADFQCAGDVQWQGGYELARTQSDGAQSTLTHLYRDEDWACYTTTLIPHVHYRMSLDTIGCPLRTFRSTKQLCSGIKDAIEAHSGAVVKAKVLHRDVSAGNILLHVESGRGLLIDWDLSKIMNPDVLETPRQAWRTASGTWQFISALRLQNPDKVHEISDDMESFVHVLTYHLLRYRQSTFNALGEIVYEIFDASYIDEDRFDKLGGHGKELFFQDRKLSEKTWRHTLAAPCANIVEGLRVLFQPLYNVVSSTRIAESIRVAIQAAEQEAHTALQTAAPLLSVFTAQLDAPDACWPTDDGNEDVYMLMPSVVPARPLKRRMAADPINDTVHSGSSFTSSFKRRRAMSHAASDS